jgi:hypothetical protein
VKHLFFDITIGREPIHGARPKDGRTRDVVDEAFVRCASPIAGRDFGVVVEFPPVVSEPCKIGLSLGRNRSPESLNHATVLQTESYYLIGVLGQTASPVMVLIVLGGSGPDGETRIVEDERGDVGYTDFSGEGAEGLEGSHRLTT